MMQSIEYWAAQRSVTGNNLVQVTYILPPLEGHPLLITYSDIQTSEAVSPASLLNMAAWQTTKGKNHDFNTKLLFWPAQRAWTFERNIEWGENISGGKYHRLQIVSDANH